MKIKCANLCKVLKTVPGTKMGNVYMSVENEWAKEQINEGWMDRCIWKNKLN